MGSHVNLLYLVPSVVWLKSYLQSPKSVILQHTVVGEHQQAKRHYKQNDLHEHQHRDILHRADNAHFQKIIEVEISRDSTRPSTLLN